MYYKRCFSALCAVNRIVPRLIPRNLEKTMGKSELETDAFLAVGLILLCSQKKKKFWQLWFPHLFPRQTCDLSTCSRQHKTAQPAGASASRLFFEVFCYCSFFWSHINRFCHFLFIPWPILAFSSFPTLPLAMFSPPLIFLHVLLSLLISNLFGFPQIIAAAAACAVGCEDASAFPACFFFFFCWSLQFLILKNSL